jgi:hypothetical protein
VNTLKYANRAKNIKMRVEPNKKMVYLHISAYKSIIADLRDEIVQLKKEVRGDIHKLPSVEQAVQELEFEESKAFEFPPKRARAPENCTCDTRAEDEIEKIKIQNEIS